MVCFEGLPCLRSKSKCFTNFVGVSEIQGRSQPHSSGWARVPISSFFSQISINFSYFILIFSSNLIYFLPHFGPPGGRLAHPGRPWLRHWWNWFCLGVKSSHFTLYFLLWAILKHSTQYKQCFIVTWVNISDALLCRVCSDAWKCLALLAAERLINTYTWNLLMQSMVLQIIRSNYHAYLKYFGITSGFVFGIQKIVQVSSFQIYTWFCNWTLFELF